MLVPPGSVALAVAGAHLRGQPLNHQLTERDAALLATTTTAPVYRLYALPTDPPKPGLVRVPDGDPGAAIEVEVWALTAGAFGTFVDAVPAPLCIGRVRLTGGSEVAGFLCEPVAVAGAGVAEITHHGGWRAYRASLGDQPG